MIRISHIKPPRIHVNNPETHVKYNTDYWRVFLGGTIEMGNSRDWQKEFVDKVNNHVFSSKQKNETSIAILNPRRDNWDSSWKQTIKNKKFKEQVDWEMDMLTCSDIVVFNILPDSKSPVTMLEIGYMAGLSNDAKVFICCPDGFYRKGNIEIVCERSGFKLFDDEDEMFDEVIKIISKKK
jgi:hypothetical protein